MENGIDTSKVMQAEEVLACVQAIHAKAFRTKRPSKSAATLLTLFRLSTACGLRRKEIIGLNMRDIMLDSPRPHIRVPASITKASCKGRRKARVVFIWDDMAKIDLQHWYQRRVAMGASPNDPFLCSLSAGTVGKRVAWHTVKSLWQTAVKPLGTIRASQLSVHQGRHAFCSHSLAAGISLPEVRDAAGHASVMTTNIYTHALDSGKKRNIYGPTTAQQEMLVKQRSDIL